jgi:hypothetical protein
MIEELNALAEKAKLFDVSANPDHPEVLCGPYPAIDFTLGESADENFARAELVAKLLTSLPAILSALKAVPVMKEALESIVQLGDTFRYESDEDVFRLVDDTQNCARQALAALEGK